MIFILPLFLLTTAMPTFIIFISILISKKKNMNQEKMSPFECGFDPLSHSRLPFSIQFFLISLIFLIFDIEITILIPLILSTYMFCMTTLILSLFFITILLTGLYFEYAENSIEWKM